MVLVLQQSSIMQSLPFHHATTCTHQSLIVVKQINEMNEMKYFKFGPVLNNNQTVLVKGHLDGLTTEKQMLVMGML